MDSQIVYKTMSATVEEKFTVYNNNARFINNTTYEVFVLSPSPEVKRT